MGKIKKIQALEILDSRGNPTIEVIVITDRNLQVKASVPSGASTGEHEALELRDQDSKRYGGKGVKKAVEIVENELGPFLEGKELGNQKEFDQTMIEFDGTENKSKCGANTILGISLAYARASSVDMQQPLFETICPGETKSLPTPMMNILNGGAHADNGLEFQEFMIRPIGPKTFSEKLRYGAEVFHALKKVLKEKGLSTNVGDEGGFAPLIDSHEEALDLILASIRKAGFKEGTDITIAIDAAASEFYDRESETYIEMKRKQHHQKYMKKTAREQIQYLKELVKKYPIDSIEDGLDQNDWEGWKELSETLGNQIQLVGDDIFVTNTKFLQRAIREKVGNSILVKLNQIGTLTETLETISLAKKNGYKTVISHRSGETEDSFIADLAVATNAGQIKTGSLSRSDRIAKYNRLLEIEKKLTT